MTLAWRRLGQSPWLFAGPVVAAAVAFVWLPMAATLALSFFDWSLLKQEGTWRGLDHYRTTLANPDFHLALVNTGVYLAALLPLQVGVPLMLAFALARARAKVAGRLYRTALFAPSVLSFPVAAVVWLWLLNPTVGFLNTLTGSLGVPPQRWLSDPDLAIWSVIAVTFWKSFGLNLLIFLAALANVPADVTEAARIDGAGPFRQAIDIELPLISPALFFALVTTIIIVLDEIVGAVDVLTEGGPYRTSSNLLYFLYERGFRHFQFGEAAAIAVMIAAIVAGVTWAQFQFGNGMSTTTDAIALPDGAHRPPARRVRRHAAPAASSSCTRPSSWPASPRCSPWPGCCARLLRRRTTCSVPRSRCGPTMRRSATSPPPSASIRSARGSPIRSWWRAPLRSASLHSRCRPPSPSA